MRLRIERLKRSWTNNFFYRDSASSRFHTAKAQGEHRCQKSPPRSSIALEENVAELLHPRQHTAETGKRDRQEDCAEHENRDEMRPDQVDAAAPAQDRLREFHEMHGG